MPLKLNVGLTKKVGEPNFGSRGASVNFEVELEADLIREPDQLREKVRYLFALAKDAVEEELNGNSPASSNDRHGNGSSHNGNSSNGNYRSSNGRPATASQVRAIHAIASRNHVDLDGQLKEFGVSTPNDLSISQASELIDALKSQPAGGRR